MLLVMVQFDVVAAFLQGEIAIWRRKAASTSNCTNVMLFEVTGE